MLGQARSAPVAIEAESSSEIPKAEAEFAVWVLMFDTINVGSNPIWDASSGVEGLCNGVDVMTAQMHAAANISFVRI